MLCVKPEHAEGVARTLGAVGVTRLLSVVAGLSTQRLEAAFPRPVAVIRSMPNTPVLVRKGVSAIAGGSHVTSADLDWAESILGAVGTVVRVTERNIDTVTGLSGPMPAYLYLVVESLIEAGVHQGLSREVAHQLVIDTFEGSAALLSRDGRISRGVARAGDVAGRYDGRGPSNAWSRARSLRVSRCRGRRGGTQSTNGTIGSQ